MTKKLKNLTKAFISTNGEIYTLNNGEFLHEQIAIRICEANNISYNLSAEDALFNKGYIKYSNYGTDKTFKYVSFSNKANKNLAFDIALKLNLSVNP